jgi:DNA-binding NtrC family response regulator
MSRFKILLVDDSPQILKALERCLKNKGYEIFAAESGRVALEILETEKIDLIITDENMPGLSGTDLLSVVKRVHPGIIRIMLTGLTDVEIVKNAVNRGELYRFFTKPWDDFELSIAVRQGLDKKALEDENMALKSALSRQEAILKKLEEEFPGISQKHVTRDGSFVIEG